MRDERWYVLLELLESLVMQANNYSSRHAELLYKLESAVNDAYSGEKEA